MIEAGVLGLRIAPIATGFWKETQVKLDSQKSAKAEVDVTANIRRASEQMALFRMREQANAINLRVKIDEASLRSANDKIKYIEHTWKQSDIKRAIRVQVYVAGATALPALTQGVVSLTAAMVDLSRVSLALPGLLAGVGASAATLLTGVNGVGAAFKAFGQGMKQSEQYARQYEQASRGLENAQRDVVKALRDANREIEDQKDKLARGQLSVEQAQLNVRRANERLYQGGIQSITDYQQALLDVKQANLDLADAVKQNGRNIQDYYAEAGKGATQTNTYKDAVDRLANAVDTFHKAQFQALGMNEQFISAMKNLAPAGQDFVLEILKMKGAWQGLQNSVQTTLFAGLGAEITTLANRQLPMLKTGMQQVAAGINNDFKVLFQTLGRQSNLDNISNIFKNTSIALKAATPGLDSFSTGLLKLSEVGTRFLPRMATAFNHVMANFEAFVNKADKDGSLNRWIDSGLKLVASLGRSLLDIGSILSSVTKAYNSATGNFGGFASTAERALSKLAKSLASPDGQGRLISWMRTSREFMKTISDTLPGIGKIFAALGDSARQYAEWAFPIFSKIGILLGNHGRAIQAVISALMLWRTVKPIISESTKLIHAFNAALEKSAAKQSSRIDQRTKALKDAYEAEGLRFAAQKQFNDMRREFNELDSRNENGIISQARRERKAALDDLAVAKKATADAKKESRAAQRAANSEIIVPGISKEEQGKFAQQQSKLYEQAKQREVAALANFDRWDKSYNDALIYRARRRKDAESQLPLAWNNLRKATNLAAEAQKNFEQVSKLTANGFVGTWARAKDSIVGYMGKIRGAMSMVAGTIIGVGVGVGVTYALDQLSAAQDRAKASADNLKESQEALAATLSKSTGSATAATIEENTRQLRDRPNPYRPGDKSANFDAANILESQLGISPAEAATLALPTEVKKREARLAPGDAAVISAVPNLEEWKKWGEKYQKNGVTPDVYGKALNGDPESIGKVEAARQAIKNAILPRAYMGAAVALGAAPNDLGAAQQQLDNTGPNGGLQGLSLAVGAERSIGNEALAKGQQEFNNARMVPQKGLNALGMRVFGPFVLGAHGALLRPDYSGTIEVDRYPDDVVPGWTQGAADKGIRVERRYPSGAIITIDPEHSLKYFNGFAKGGPVWGAGSATSDSIPAMLSNGEYVINARSAAAIGHDTLHRMNAMKFSGGGPVGDQPFNGENGNIFTQAFGWLRDHNLIPFMPPEPDRDAVAAAHGVPKATIGMPYRSSAAVDSSPVELPYQPPSPGSPISPDGKGIGGNIGGGVLYIPRFGGSGALPDTISGGGRIGTDASRAAGALVNSDANILDYLIQVANANGLRPGSGPASNYVGDEGSKLAAELGVPTHYDDGGQHSVRRALDIGSLEQGKNGSITNFVKSWMADPQKVAATRQLIFQDPNTGEVFAIHHGVAYTGKAAWDVYGSSFSEHQDHVHLALEGVPLQAFSQSGAGAPNVPSSIAAPPSSLPKAPDVPAGPAAAAPGPTAIAPPTGAPAGPAIDAPTFLDPFYFLRQIGAAILKGILGFFGIDGSGFIDALFAIGDAGKKVGPQVDEIPEPDQKLISDLDSEIAKYEAIGTPAALQTAEQIKKGKEDYLKQFNGANAAKSAGAAADYFDSIGQKDLANNLRQNANAVADPKNPERFGPVTTVPGTGGAPTVLPRPGSGGGGIAPPANYSGGTPEVHGAVYRAFKEAGFPDSEWPSLVNLLNHENDTWDPTRPTGGPNSDARGIFQFLSTTWGSVGMTPSDDPYTQAVAGMKYIKKNYATPTGAWMFWQHPTRPPFDQNWYSLGGLIKLAKGGWARKPKLPGDPVDPGDFMAQFEESNYGPLTLMGSPNGMPYLVDPMDNAAGGYISGPGGPTDDKIPAMLSNGEFVMRAAAVKHWGVDRLHAMNKFSGGGLIGGGEGVNSIIAERQKQAQKDLLLSAFTGAVQTPSTSDAYNSGKSSVAANGDLLGGGGDFNSAPGPKLNVLGGAFQVGVPKWLSGASKLVSDTLNPVNVLDWVDSKLGGSKDKNGLAWDAFSAGLNAINPGFGLYDAATGRRGNAGRQVLPFLAVPDLVKDSVTMSDPTAGVLDRLGSFANVMGVVAPAGAKGISSGADVLSRARALRGVQFDLGNANRVERKAIKDAIIELRAISPDAGLTKVSIKDFWDEFAGTQLEQALGAAYQSTKEIALNRDYFGRRREALGFSLDREMEKSARTGWGPDTGGRGGIFSLLAHEYGHINDFTFGADKMGDFALWDALKAKFVAENPQYATQMYSDPLNTALSAFDDAAIEQAGTAYSDFLLKNLFDYGINKPPSYLAFARDLLDNGFSMNPEEILKGIDRYEVVADAFADVVINRGSAKSGSKAIYDVLQSYSEDATRKLGLSSLPPRLYDFTAEAFPGPKAIGKPASKSGGNLGNPEVGNLGSAWLGAMPAPRPGAGFGPGMTWDDFAQLANGHWPSIEELNNRSGSRKNGIWTPQQLEALSDYSGSSSVNKTLRGADNLVGRVNLLKEFIDARSKMSGLGGDIRQTLFPPFEDIPGITSKMVPDIWKIGEQVVSSRIASPDVPLDQLITNIADSIGVSSQQIWEASFVELLQSAKKATSRALTNIDSIPMLDSAFSDKTLLPQDVWVTRMIQDFGNGIVDDPSSLIGKTISNPGYTSTAGGITYAPQKGRDWWKGVFGERPIMQQILVPQGTPGLWFGGGENELLLPRNLEFTPQGFQTFEELLKPEDARRYAEVSQIMADRSGKDVLPQFKIWGTMGFPSNPADVPDVGFDAANTLLSGLSKKGPGDIPAWMKMLEPRAPGTELFTAFRIPSYRNLGYASGGHVRGPGGPKSDMIPAMLSNGEFVMNAAATKHWGINRLHAMNKFADGGPVDPKKVGADAYEAGKNQTGANAYEAGKEQVSPGLMAYAAGKMAAGLGSIGPRLGGGGGGGAAVKGGKDPRSAIAAAPTSESHIHPALAGGIKGAFNTIGSIASQAAALGGAAASAGITGGAPIPGAGQAASALVSAGFQMAGDVAVGAANVLSSLLVGTVTPSQTGQGYGAPLLPQQQTPSVSNFQSIHNGNVVTNNLSEYSRLKDRKDAQKAAPFFNRVNR